MGRAFGRPLALIPVGALLFACSSNDPAAPSDAGNETSVVSCDTDPRVEPYAENLSKTSASGNFTVTLIRSNPAPPAIGTDTWTVRLTDRSGQPIPNGDFVVTPFMPDHGHGTSVTPVVTPQGDGTYTVDPLYLFMPGVWRVTFSPGADAGPDDDAVFFFCVAG